jgi:hypothetical protein
MSVLNISGSGRSPCHSRTGRKNAAHQAAVRRWNGERGDPRAFTREILPGPRGVPIAELAYATGLSEHCCSLIRLGKKVQHPRHWEALQRFSSRTASKGRRE